MANVMKALQLVADENLVWSDDFAQIKPFLAHFLASQPENEFAQMLAEVLISE